MKKPTTSAFRYDGRRKFSKDLPTNVAPFYTKDRPGDEADRGRQLDALADRMDQAQNRMHADEQFGVVVLFQAMDAGGKDSSIRHVFKGLNPSRFEVAEFKKPSKEDEAHDFLWRFWKELPKRGYIGIFNRTYYEEVLAVRVHPERLAENSIPGDLVANQPRLWKERYADIVNLEDYLYRNGFRVVKFYLHVNKQEQGQRLINRLKSPEKQWKLSENDLEEREHWDAYMQVYEDAINATATKRNPWYVIPSDDRHNQQLIIAYIMTEILESLPTAFPQTDDKKTKQLIQVIKQQDNQ